MVHLHFWLRLLRKLEFGVITCMTIGLCLRWTCMFSYIYNNYFTKDLFYSLYCALCFLKTNMGSLLLLQLAALRILWFGWLVYFLIHENHLTLQFSLFTVDDEVCPCDVPICIYCSICLLVRWIHINWSCLSIPDLT